MMVACLTFVFLKVSLKIYREIEISSLLTVLNYDLGIL